MTLARLRSRGERDDRWDRFHFDDRAFYERVRDGYLRLAAAEPGRFVVLNADRDEGAIARDVARSVDELLAAPAR